MWVAVGVFVGVFVFVLVGVFVAVFVGVNVGVAVLVGVFVDVLVGVFVAVAVGVPPAGTIEYAWTTPFRTPVPTMMLPSEIPIADDEVLVDRSQPVPAGIRSARRYVAVPV